MPGATFWHGGSIIYYILIIDIGNTEMSENIFILPIGIALTAIPASSQVRLSY
jgi:hypothetical protein